MKSFKDIRENKLADITDSIRGHIGLINANSTVTPQEKSRAAKKVSDDHNISLNAASKFVDDYCKMKREETELDESNQFKRVNALSRELRDKAAGANLKGNKHDEERYSKRLTKVLDYRNKMLATESHPDYNTIDVDIQNLHNHVSTKTPTLSNINAMHDMVKRMATKHEMSSDLIYDMIKNNQQSHPKYREAASL